MAKRIRMLVELDADVARRIKKTAIDLECRYATRIERLLMFALAAEEKENTAGAEPTQPTLEEEIHDP